MKLNYPEKFLKKNLWKIVFIGYLADFFGAFLLLMTFLGLDYLGVETYLGTDVFSNPIDFLLITLAVMFSSFCIFKFNSHFVLGKYFPANDVKKLSLSLAIFTAPYLFFVPVTLFN